MIKYDPEMLCPLCGDRKPKTNGKKWISREHVPPKSLFLDGTSDLITVPSCDECNNLTSKYDLDFKIALGLYIGNSSPEFWKSTLVSLNKSDIRKKKKQIILNETSKILHRTQAGWWGHRIKFDKKPIKIVVSKIVKGLHWHLSKEIIPSDAKVTIQFLQQGEKVKEEIQQILNQYGKLLVKGSCFQTQYAITVDNKHASIWKLTFYGQDCFIAIIDPKRKMQNDK